MNPPRKFVIVDRLHAHSIWDLMQHIAIAHIERGDEVHFCRWDDGQDGALPPTPSGVQCHEISVGKKLRRWDVVKQWKVFLRQFKQLIVEIQPDIVHTNFTVPGALARRVAKRCGIPVVVTTQHELYGSMSPHLRLLTRVTERYADQIVYVSEAVAQSYGREAPVYEVSSSLPRHVVIQNGIDVDAFASAHAADGDRVPGRILCTGRLVPVKGYDILLKAMPRIIARHPHAHVRIAGSGPDEARLKDLAVRLGIADHVEFLGWVDRVRLLDEMRRCSAVVIPSDGSQEGFGLVAAEAMAAGVPIVASRISVFEEVLGSGDSVCARLFVQGNVDHLADEIADAFECTSKSMDLRDRALNRVRSRFSAMRMVNDYSRLYDQLVESNAVPK